jgi:hypothetical protein
MANIISFSALKLPDGGAKLKAKLEQIETLLNSTNDISDKVSDMSISDKLDIRKETVLRSNKPFDTHATNLLRAHDSDHVSNRFFFVNVNTKLFIRQEQYV